ncbi:MULTISPECIES: ATP-grasp domain-containing protein [Pseudoalteromonas]|uniref:ATP-grasp domain-containing protein n=1 Tax=Pseudoalteromonas TaxID=53246 RepID=UPI000F77D2CC|nr:MULTISPECIES: ATP-grasp domain-containing protein [Pseudoalteromonas]MCG7562517.1 ATP-grasp domain-containing protein [Pseudoalteromonas sp. McH1-42]
MNILLTSVGRRTYLVEYFKEVLSSLGGVVHASNSIDTYAIRQADRFTITPNIYSEDYIDYLIDYCKENEIDMLISLFDIDLPVLAKNKSKFANNGIQVVVSDQHVIDTCNDKWKTYEFLTQNDIITPKTFLNLETALSALDEKSLNFPLIVKPRWGMGSIGIYKAENREELAVFYKKVLNDIKNSYLKFESQAALEESVLIQQAILGDEYGVEAINDLSANFVTSFVKHKIAMRAGETDQAVTLDNPHLAEIGQRIAEKLAHIAVLDIDFLEQDGHFYVLELNARFGGQYPFSHLAGANIPKQIIEWAMGKGTSSTNITVIPNVRAGKELVPVIISK